MDQNNTTPQQPAPQTIIVQTAAPEVKTGFFQKIVGFFRYLFGEGRIILFLAAAGVLIVEFGNKALSSILSKDKKLVDETTQKNAELQAKEDSANQQADALVQKADALPGQEQPVTDDWYKNAKK